MKDFRFMSDFEFINECIKDFKTEFKVNKEKRTVTCIITTQEDFLSRIIRFGFAEEFYRLPFELKDLRDEDLDVRKYVGVAKCNPEDEWDEQYGKQLAEYRAMVKRKADINNDITNFVRRMNARIDNIWLYGRLYESKRPNER